MPEANFHSKTQDATTPTALAAGGEGTHLKDKAMTQKSDGRTRPVTSDYQRYLETKPRRQKRKNHGPKTKWTLPTKPKESGVDRERQKNPDQANPAGSSKSFEQRLIDHVDASENPEVAVKYQALLGAASPISKPIMSNRPLLRHGAEYIVGEIQKRLAADDCEFGVQTSRVLVSPANCADIPTKLAQRAKSFYQLAGLNGVAGLRLCPVPRAPLGEAGIAMDIVAVFWGSDAKRKVDDRSVRLRKPDGIDRLPARWHDPDDEDSLRSAMTVMLVPPFDRLPADDPFSAASGGFEANSSAGDRAFVALMCRAQLPIRKGLMYFGGGKPIVIAANAEMEDLLRTQCKADPEVLHEDEIPHFGFSELRRLGWDQVNVPVIKLH